MCIRMTAMTLDDLLHVYQNDRYDFRPFVSFAMTHR